MITNCIFLLLYSFRRGHAAGSPLQKIRKGQTQLAALWGRRDGAQLPVFIC